SSPQPGFSCLIYGCASEVDRYSALGSVLQLAHDLVHLGHHLGGQAVAVAAGGEAEDLAAADRLKEADGLDELEGCGAHFRVVPEDLSITAETGDEVFVHYRAIKTEGVKNLEAGQKVVYAAKQGTKRLEAEAIHVD
ncbi:cold-shock protein, partial [Streptomyces sp. NPDC054946]